MLESFPRSISGPSLDSALKAPDDVAREWLYDQLQDHFHPQLNIDQLWEESGDAFFDVRDIKAQPKMTRDLWRQLNSSRREGRAMKKQFKGLRVLSSIVRRKVDEDIAMETMEKEELEASMEALKVEEGEDEQAKEKTHEAQQKSNDQAQ